jgi:hypothetical protein
MASFAESREEIMEWQMPWDRAALEFPILHELKRTFSDRQGTAVEVLPLDHAFLSQRLDTYSHPDWRVGLGEFALYVVHSSSSLCQVPMRRGQSIVYPAENMHPECATSGPYPADVEEQGETIEQALNREVAERPEYVVIVHLKARRMSAQIGMTTDLTRRLLRSIAYGFWQRRGMPFGDDLSDWLQARRSLGIRDYARQDL